jgi:hypothetical protein
VVDQHVADLLAQHRVAHHDRNNVAGIIEMRDAGLIEPRTKPRHWTTRNRYSRKSKTTSKAVTERMATFACSAQVEQSWTDQIADVA